MEKREVVPSGGHPRTEAVLLPTVLAAYLCLALFACRTGAEDRTGAGAADPAAMGGENGEGSRESRQGRKGRTAPDARIVFFGDSITEAGERPDGYVTLVRRLLEDLYPRMRIEVLAAGVAGDTVPDLQDRLERDVLSEDPTHVVVFIGVNDAGQRRFISRLPEEDKRAYRDGLLDLMNRTKAAGAAAILCTPAVFGDDPAKSTNENRILEEYAEISREVAVQSGAALCDLRAAFKDYLLPRNRSGRYQGVVTVDGVHLNEAGNRLVAAEMIEVLDLIGTGRDG